MTRQENSVGFQCVSCHSSKVGVLGALFVLSSPSPVGWEQCHRRRSRVHMDSLGSRLSGSGAVGVLLVERVAFAAFGLSSSRAWPRSCGFFTAPLDPSKSRGLAVDDRVRFFFRLQRTASCVPSFCLFLSQRVSVVVCPSMQPPNAEDEPRWKQQGTNALDNE